MESVDRLPVNVGVDVGQIHDPTAICVTEVHQVETGEVKYLNNPTIGHVDSKGFWIPPRGIDKMMRSEYVIRFIKRLPLNTFYPDVADYIADMLDNELFEKRSIKILIDVTGVGRPVYDSLKKKIYLKVNNANVHHVRFGMQVKLSEKHMLQLKPISFVHGEQYNRSKGTLGKAFLVSKLQSILQEKRLHAPDTQEVKAMLDELRVYEIKVSDNGKDTYGAKIGKHDDLATAAGLSCLEDPYDNRISYSGKVY
jgi:hypothetical protein